MSALAFILGLFCGTGFGALLMAAVAGARKPGEQPW